MAVGPYGTALIKGPSTVGSLKKRGRQTMREWTVWFPNTVRSNRFNHRLKRFSTSPIDNRLKSGNWTEKDDGEVRFLKQLVMTLVFLFFLQTIFMFFLIK